MTAARARAEPKLRVSLSERAAMRRKSLRRQKTASTPALTIPSLVQPDLAPAGVGAWNEQTDALGTQVPPQPVGVVALVGDQAMRAPGPARPGSLHVAGVAGGEG